MATVEPNPFGALRESALFYAKRVSKKFPQKRMSVAAPGFLHDVLFVGGLISITIGSYMMYRPLGPLVGGVIAVQMGMLLSRTEPK